VFDIDDVLLTTLYVIVSSSRRLSMSADCVFAAAAVDFGMMSDLTSSVTRPDDMDVKSQDDKSTLSMSVEALTCDQSPTTGDVVNSTPGSATVSIL